MTGWQKFWITLAAAHLFIALLSACSVPVANSKYFLISPFLRWYGALSGANNGFGFFKQVGSGLRANFTLIDGEGKRWTDSMHIAGSRREIPPLMTTEALASAFLSSSVGLMGSASGQGGLDVAVDLALANNGITYTPDEKHQEISLPNDDTNPNQEINLRINSNINMVSTVGDVVMQQWAAAMFGRNPKAVAVEIQVEIYDPGTMEQYRNGYRPQWVESFKKSYLRKDFAFPNAGGK